MKLRILSLVVLGLLLLAACGGKATPTTVPSPSPSADVPTGDAQSLIAAGQAALDAGDYATAVSNFKAAAANPSLEAYFGLGNAYTRQGNLAKAMDAYQQALDINPNHAATLSNLGVVYYQLGKLTEAKEAFTRALNVSPEDAATHYLLGAADLQLGDDVAAEKSFRQALKIDPTLPEAHFGMGMLYRARGDTENAIAEFETFQAGPPAQDPRAKTEAEKILKELKGQP
ncbi:MAG: tetratricopeptide repeat protein [Chloroflexi bacterium]|nr:tetratricopeptide repeat protein [Chloroflexota bacterium]